jgi:hypothetical protein
MKSLKSYLWGMTLIGIVLLLTFFPFSTAMAYTVGPLNPGLGSNVAGVGSEPWVNPNEISTPGSSYASVTLYQGHRSSNYLQGTQYGFNIGPEMEILGIELTINRMSNSANFYDSEVRLVRNGTVVGDNNADTTNAWPNSFNTSVYGGPTDLWGLTWTPADIGAQDFGVALSVYRSDNGASHRYAEVDSLQITVYYGNTTTTSLECGDGSPVMYGGELLCVMTVSQVAGEMTPTGTVNWSTDGSGTFNPNPCTLSEVDGLATCSATYTPDAVGTGTHLVTASYSGDEFFTPNEASQPVTVTPRQITVTADPKNKLYGDPDPDLTYLVTQGSLVFSDTFTGTLTRDAGEDVGTYAILQGTLALNENYDLTYVGDNLTIDPAAPTCDVSPYAVAYDGQEHTADGTCLGVLGELLAGLDLSSTSHTNAGTYTDPWVFTDQTGNYQDVNGTIEDSISQVDASCDLMPYDVVYDGTPHEADGYCTGVMGENLEGLDLSATNHINAGSYTDEWVFNEVNGNYNDQDGTVEDNISKAEPSCSVNGYILEYNREVHTAPGLCTGVLDEELSGLDLSGTAHTEIGVYLDEPWTFTDLSGNYNNTLGTVNDEITLRMVTVVADPQRKIVGHKDPVLTYQVTVGSLLDGDIFTGVLARQPGQVAGTYAILQGTLSLPSYYVITYVGADFTIFATVYLLPFVIK